MVIIAQKLPQLITVINDKKNRLDFILLNIGHAQHDGDWNFKNIKSPFARIHYVLNGEASIILQDQIIPLSPGHLYLTPAYVQHSYSCTTTFSLYYMHIYENPELQSSIFDRYIFPKKIIADNLLQALLERLLHLNPDRELPIYDPQSYDNSTELIKNFANQITSPFPQEAETQAIIHQFMSRFLVGAKNKIPNFEKRLICVLDYIDKHIHRKISIEELAELIFLSKDHLIRLFKKHMNDTPLRYMNQKKIEKAQLMMLIDNSNIQELSYKLGFDNTSYFNRLFKKMTGETPTSYKCRIAK